MYPGQLATIRPRSSRYHESHWVQAVPSNAACTSRSLAASTSGETEIEPAWRERIVSSACRMYAACASS